MDEKSLKVSLELIKFALPEMTEQITIVHKAHGYLDLPPKAINFLSKSDENPWAQFYENPLGLKGLFIATLLGPENLSELGKEFAALSQDERQQVALEFKESVLLETQESPENFNPDLWPRPTPEEAQALMAEMSEEERLRSLHLASLTFYFAVTSMCSFFSVMSFGQTMPSLIGRAKTGDDEAFFKAVQVDKTTLFAFPEFRRRLLKAQLGCEPEFLNKLSNAIKGPSLNKKIPHRRLMLFFYLLDDEGFLDMPLENLLDICKSLGLYSGDDVQSLGKRRQQYKKLAGRQIRF